MILKSEFELIQRSFRFQQDQLEGVSLTQHEAEIIHRWTKPYVCVIHRVSGQGFYLDRNYRHIVSVDNIGIPENPVETTLNHQACVSDRIEWVVKIEECCTGEDAIFDSYWLY